MRCVGHVQGEGMEDLWFAVQGKGKEDLWFGVWETVLRKACDKEKHVIAHPCNLIVFS